MVVLLLFICPLLTLDGEDVIVHKMAVWCISSLMSFCLFLLHKINKLFTCKLIVITLTTFYLISYHSLTVYCSWNSRKCICRAVIRSDVDPILKTIAQHFLSFTSSAAPVLPSHMAGKNSNFFGHKLSLDMWL